MNKDIVLPPEFVVVVFDDSGKPIGAALTTKEAKRIARDACHEPGDGAQWQGYRAHYGPMEDTDE